MTIREIEAGDLPAVSHLVRATFNDSVAATLPPQGLATFMELSSVEAFARRMQNDVLMLLHEESGSVTGMVEFRQGRHISLLFVTPLRQRGGIGRKLLQAALQGRLSDRISVKAALPSVPAYRRYGFRPTGPEGAEHGLIYLPMELHLPAP